MTIDEVHAVALDIMKEIHDFCISNDIQYSLAYGSLIGAIRHKGFIPWDDDIDVWMTRPNFEKFTKTFKSKKGYRHSSMYDKDSLICFDRVYETEKTFVKHGIKSCDGNTGIWVDIMPIDGVPNDESKRNEQYHEFSRLIQEMKDARAWLMFKEKGGGIKQCVIIARLLIIKIMNGTIKNLSSENIKANHEGMVNLSKQYGWGHSDSCCYFQCGDAFNKKRQEILPVQSFNNYMLTIFEDVDLMIIKDYDALLRSIYGDYMKLPPVEARHKSHGTCFWK